MLEQGGDDEGNQVDIWEALEALPPGRRRINLEDEDRLLQEAIEASMREAGEVGGGGGEVVSQDPVDDLAAALAASQREAEEAERMRKQEEEMLNKILELSLSEK